jgi:hypothetical protein
MAPYESGLTRGLYAAWRKKLARESHVQPADQGFRCGR